MWSDLDGLEWTSRLFFHAQMRTKKTESDPHEELNIKNQNNYIICICIYTYESIYIYIYIYKNIDKEHNIYIYIYVSFDA